MSEGLWPATTLGDIRNVLEDFGIEPYELAVVQEPALLGSIVYVVVHEEDYQQAYSVISLIELPIGSRIAVMTRAQATASGRP